jgi:hypothetical protein
MSKDIEWRGLPDYPGYEISNTGLVKNVLKRRGTQVGKVLSPRPGDLGHLSVCLMLEGERKMAQIHRLVCEAFHGPQPPDKPHAAHGDGNPGNNNDWNVRWATRSENEQDKVAHGRSNQGERHSNAKLTEEDIKDIREIGRFPFTLKEIAAEYDVGYKCISSILNHVTWKHVK